MPTYEYACATCGSFTAVRPLVEFRDPQPCPQCAAPAPRVTLTMPAFKGMFSGGGPSGELGRSLQGCAHTGGCRCC
jgi:putative FmdB family regulatory protein